LVTTTTLSRYRKQKKKKKRRKRGRTYCELYGHNVDAMSLKLRKAEKVQILGFSLTISQL